jgi:hypothetical protein
VRRVQWSSGLLVKRDPVRRSFPPCPASLPIRATVSR